MASYFEKGRGDATKVVNGKKIKGGWRYDFELFGQRHRAPRGYSTKSASDESVKNAAIASGLPWGRHEPNGVTFHSIRHFASTKLARLGVPADRRGPVTGHEDLDMELWYRHLFPEDERADTEALSAALTLEEDVTAGPRRVSRPGRPRAASAGVLRRAG